jgi:hypothetical protein
MTASKQSGNFGGAEFSRSATVFLALLIATICGAAVLAFLL